MIYGIKIPCVTGTYGDSHSRCDHANTKIVKGNYEISIAMDDSCGGLENLSRSEIRVYNGALASDDITYDVFPEFVERCVARDGFPDETIYHAVDGTFENLFTAMYYVRKKVWRETGTV